MKRRELYKSIYIDDFKPYFKHPLEGATNEAYAILQNCNHFYRGVRILAEKGKCIKIVKAK